MRPVLPNLHSWGKHDTAKTTAASIIISIIVVLIAIAPSTVREC